MKELLLSSYPHPYLMNDYWQYPTVSMGLGPILSIYQARFNRYLVARKIISPEQEPRVFCFMGDGESDEPESLGALSIAAREKLDNLTFIVNCNLQRLDGPVRGNSKIIQELESVFHGAGWNVFSVRGGWLVYQKGSDSEYSSSTSLTFANQISRNDQIFLETAYSF